MKPEVKQQVKNSETFVVMAEISLILRDLHATEEIILSISSFMIQSEWLLPHPGDNPLITGCFPE